MLPSDGETTTMLRHSTNTFFIVISAIVLFVVATLSLMTPDIASSGDPDGQAGAKQYFAVYYLHGARRCHTCLTIEAEAESALKRFYAEQLERGEIKWQVLNMETKENRHFVKEFSLVSSTLVVAEIKDSKTLRFETLPDVWKYSSDSLRFAKYVKETIDKFMATTT